MARLIKTEKEVEGRYTERGSSSRRTRSTRGRRGRARSSGGRRREGQDGYERARGEARFTSDVRLPGMLDAAVPPQPARAREPEANRRERVRRGAGSARRARSRVRPSGSRRRWRTQGAPVAALAADTPGAGPRGARPDRRGVGRAGAAARSGRGRTAQDRSSARRARYERGDYERGLAEADVVVEAEFRTQTLHHNSLETHQCVCDWRGDTLDVYISTQYIWGVRDEVAEQFDLAAGQGARRLRVHGRRLRRESLGRAATRSSRRSSRAERVGRCATRWTGARRTWSPATATRRFNASLRCAFGRHARRCSAASTSVRSAGMAGCRRPRGRCRCSTRARTCAPSSTARS